MTPFQYSVFLEMILVSNIFINEVNLVSVQDFESCLMILEIIFKLTY